jgi:hypothetical protein
MRVPFVYKPGIQRDGGDFQDEYCIDGQWIRFVGGKIRKMKGQSELVAPEPLEGITFLDMYFNGTNPILIYATIDGVHRCIVNDGLTNISNDTEVLAGLDNNLSRTWQGVKFIKDGRAAYGLLITSNGSNMLSNVNGTLSWRYLDEDEPFEVPQQVEASGGILYSNPCLFLYGNNGALLWSRTSDPLNFSGEDSGKETISENKLIFGASIRGGTNAPSFLFWTENSVIYLTNVADSNAQVPFDFQREVVTNNSSVMSFRCIVQYDSLFFWLGTDRAFVYNGIVDSIRNDVNFQFFLENVDLTKRQKIYGYKVARYGEIRWAYPEKRYSNRADIGCTRELVYNVRENSWYDNAVPRDCATVYEASGDIFSFGDSCRNYPYNPDNAYKAIWKQETGYDEVRRDGLHYNIPSFFTTPYFGLSAFNPAKNGSVIDKYLVLDQIEPDFPAPEGYTRTVDDILDIGVSYRKYATTPKTATHPVNFNLNSADSPGKIDFRVSGRFMTITFASEYPYNVGNILINFKEGDNQ